MIRRLISGPRPFPKNSSLDSIYGIRPLLGFQSYTSSVSHLPQNDTIHPQSLSSFETLSTNLEIALNNHQVGKAWKTFSKFKSLHGFPKNELLKKLIMELSYSSNPHWLKKGYELVLSIRKEKSDFLHYDFLANLGLSLARTQMPIPASTVVRLMLEGGKFLPMDIWRIFFLHIVKTEIGTYLASDILVEICTCFLNHVKDHGVTKHSKFIKPDTMIFNLVLDACVRFRSTLMAEKIIELMPVVGIAADASTIVVMARIHEMNGQRDEMKKLKGFIDRVPARLVCHYRQFYDSLLSLHFKFNDFDAAAELIFDMYSCHGLFRGRGRLIKEDWNDSQKPKSVTIGSCNLKTGLRLQIEPELLQKDFVLSGEIHPELVMFKDGKLVPSHKAIAKLMSNSRRHGKVGELSKLLVRIKKEAGVSGEGSLSFDVLCACIQLGWLEFAHDILDDMELAGIPMACTAYLSLLRAYCKGNMLKDATVLMKQMRKLDWLMGFSDEEVISKCLLEEGFLVPSDKKTGASFGNSCLVESLVQEMNEEQKSPQLVYEINSSIYFFCKGNMMEDALKTYWRMQERGIQPTVETFASLVNGYSSLKMYREITILWGEIRRRLDSGHLGADRDLHEMLLWNFIQGGYFERVMEILEDMKRHEMYTDKWKYKREFLKLHKNLYRRLKAEDAKTEAQVKRLEYVRAFRKWLSTD